MAQMVAFLVSMCKALWSILSTTKKKKKREVQDKLSKKSKLYN
jgi:hypothetical protein